MRFLAAGLTGLLFFLVAYASAAPNEPSPWVDLEARSYRVDMYIEAARDLQSMGHPAALRRLREMAHDANSKTNVIVLCRMLFAPHRGARLRRAGIGQPWFPGATTQADWPLEPIELVDGVPFLIVRGYDVAGLVESVESYLEYSEANGEWSHVPYGIKTMREKRAALRTLLSSRKWKTHADADERRQFLAQQIQ
jgi:hypothetical protein